MLDSNDMSMKEERLGVGEGVRLEGEGMDIWGGDCGLSPMDPSGAMLSPLLDPISETLSVAVESGMMVMVVVVESMSATSTMGRGMMLTTCWDMLEDEEEELVT